jgi:peptidoglycan/xylan/chitin deacetylase (PgdA/CDA1 family)
MTAAQFERRLDLLHRGGYPVLPLEEALARLTSGTLPPRAVSITVDDGAYDFLAVAYPILRRRGLPVTLYGSTYYAVDQRPVFTVMLSYLLWRGLRRGETTVRLADGSQRILRSPAEAKAAAAEIVAGADRAGLSAAEKDLLLAELAAQLAEDYEALRRDRLLSLMTLEELASLDTSVADVQLHTHRHRVPDDRSLFLREISDNRAALGLAGLDPARLVHFCYPSGVHRRAFLPWLREAGIRSATTCIPGLAGPDSDSLLLPRFVDSSTVSELDFEAWASGLRQALRRPHPLFPDG